MSDATLLPLSQGLTKSERSAAMIQSEARSNGNLLSPVTGLPCESFKEPYSPFACLKQVESQMSFSGAEIGVQGNVGMALHVSTVLYSDI